MWSRFTISCTIPPTEVIRRVASALAVSTGLHGSGESFRGAVYENGFQLTRTLDWMERGVPLIAVGRVTSDGKGTKVEVRTWPRWWVVVVVCLFSMAGLGAMANRMFIDPTVGLTCFEWVFFSAMAAVGWVILFIGATIEERVYQRAFSKLVGHGT